MSEIEKFLDQKVRLKPEEIKIIKEVATLLFGEEIEIYIFGSRADLNKKGGDIDIYIESKNQIKLEDILNFYCILEKKGIERKVDLLVKDPTKRDKEIYQIAKNTGVKI